MSRPARLGFAGERERRSRRVDSNAEAQRKTNGAGLALQCGFRWSIQTTPRTRPDPSTSISRAIAPLRIKRRPVWAAASRKSSGAAKRPSTDARRPSRRDRTLQCSLDRASVRVRLRVRCRGAKEDCRAYPASPSLRSTEAYHGSSSPACSGQGGLSPSAGARSLGPSR